MSETKDLCDAILREMFIPVMKKPFQDFTHLSTNLLKGMWAINPFIEVEAFSAFLKYLSGMSVEPCSTWYSRFLFNFQIFVHEVSRYLQNVISYEQH